MNKEETGEFKELDLPVVLRWVRLYCRSRLIFAGLRFSIDADELFMYDYFGHVVNVYQNTLKISGRLFHMTDEVMTAYCIYRYFRRMQLASSTEALVLSNEEGLFRSIHWEGRSNNPFAIAFKGAKPHCRRVPVKEDKNGKDYLRIYDGWKEQLCPYSPACLGL